MEVVINLKKFQIYSIKNNGSFLVRKLLDSGNTVCTIFKDFESALSFAVIN